jgi:ferredoxin-thioredoxin reductase catalytic subunit
MLCSRSQAPSAAQVSLKKMQGGAQTFMHVRENEDKELVALIRQGLEKSGGYCPCRVEKTPENKCICQEFRDQIADPTFEGYCHCMLYYKSLD